MLVDGALTGSPDDVASRARELEAEGYAGAFTGETSHDPFLPLAVVAEHTERIEIGTSIAVAFARTPMSLAMIANDLQVASHGRFILGLGSQVKPHIERRFSMPWSHPAPRMREFVLALRAIWSSWDTGERLDFRGEFYTHTLMTPFFSPGPNPHGIPKVFLAAVGDRMTEVAGEVADGIILHPFTTERYVREVTMPALERGFAAGAKPRAGFEVSSPIFVVTGDDDQGFASARTAAKQQIAFYGSTPGYRGVLELHGWGETGDELNQLSRKGEWVAMGDRITDEMLEAFAIVATPDEVAARLRGRFSDVVDRISFYTPYPSDPALWARVVTELKT
jgi:probable F420-dependent oxidoreductase